MVFQRDQARAGMAAGKAKLSEAVATKWKGKLQFFDTGKIVASEVECESTGEGSVGPGAVGKVTSLSVLVSGCKNTAKARNEKGEEVANKCGTFETLKISHLPWHSELAISGGSLRDVLTAEGSGSPSYSITCTGVIDTCTVEEGKQLSGVAVNDGEKAVQVKLGGEGVFKCTLGGKATAGGSLEYKG